MDRGSGHIKLKIGEHYYRPPSCIHSVSTITGNNHGIIFTSILTRLLQEQVNLVPNACRNCLSCYKKIDVLQHQLVLHAIFTIFQGKVDKLDMDCLVSRCIQGPCASDTRWIIRRKVGRSKELKTGNKSALSEAVSVSSSRPGAQM